MELIITEQGTADLLRRVRSPHIAIMNPETGDKVIVFKVVEATFINGKLYDERFKDDIAVTLTNQEMLDTVTFTDPISNQPATLAVATVAKAIETYFINEYMARNPPATP